LKESVNGLKTPLASLESAVRHNGTQEKAAFDALGKTVADACKTSADTIKQAEDQTRKAVVAEIQKLAGTPADVQASRLDTLNGHLKALCSELGKVHGQLAQLPHVLAVQHEQLARQMEAMSVRDRNEAARGLTVARPGLRKSRWPSWLWFGGRNGQ
jgi:hypothetical protein